MNSIDVDYNHDLKALVELVASVRHPGSFYASGAIEAPMPSLEITGVGTIAFPVLERQAQEIIAQAEQAPYGRGAATVVDTSVRKVWQLPPDKIRLGGHSWNKTLNLILDRALKGLGCQGMPVSQVLYKMLAYDEGSFFAPHRDTEKATGMFATLVVVLPSFHQGGEIVVRHADREVKLDLTSERDDVPSRLSYAAFYADCEHEVRPITKGNRICLVYNLIQQQQQRGRRFKLPQSPDYHAETVRVSEILKARATQLDGPSKIVYLLDHQYSPAGLSFAALKNGDAALCGVLTEAAERAGYVAHLGIVHIEESGAAQLFGDPFSDSWSGWDGYGYDDDDSAKINDYDFEVVETFERGQSIDNWVDVHDCSAVFGKLPLMAGELLPTGALDNEKPDAQRVSEATGNEGASYELAYHRAAIVLWPMSRHTETLLEAGGTAAIPYLQKLVDDWVAIGDRSRSSTKWREIASLSADVTSRWSGTEDGCWDPPEVEGQRRCEMLTVLHAMGDPISLAYFIEKVVVFEFDGIEQDLLLASCDILGVKASGDLIAKLISVRMKTSHQACAKLLERVAMGSVLDGGSPSTVSAARRKIAGAIVTALSDLDPLPQEDGEQDDWLEDLHTTAIEPLTATTIASLLRTLQNLKVKRSMSAAVAVIVADPQTFAPVTLIVPALSMLFLSQGNSVDGEENFLKLWEHASEYLLARSETPPRKPIDWAQATDIDCACDDCKNLKEFAASPTKKTHRFRVRKDRRKHLHRTIDNHGLDMSHKTERHGSPYTLVCIKTRRRYQKTVRQYKKDIKCLQTLIDALDNRAGVSRERLRRMNEAIGVNPPS